MEKMFRPSGKERAPAMNKVLYECSSTTDGNMSRRWAGADVANTNRNSFLRKFGLSMSDMVEISVPDINGTNVLHVGEQEKGSFQEADAFVTTQANVALVLLTGDCAPVVCHDPVKNVLALMHGSRASVGRELPKKVVEDMCSLGSLAKDIKVFVGPTIRASSYFFTNEVLTQGVLSYEMSDENWKPFLIKCVDGVQVDVVGYLSAQLKGAGVASITDEGVDTFSDVRYPSHHRSVVTGEAESRFMTLAVMNSVGK